MKSKQSKWELVKLKILGLIQNSGITYLFISNFGDSKLGTKNIVNSEKQTNKKTLKTATIQGLI